jgi:hypothetical protein
VHCEERLKVLLNLTCDVFNPPGVLTHFCLGTEISKLHLAATLFLSLNSIGTRCVGGLDRMLC